MDISIAFVVEPILYSFIYKPGTTTHKPYFSPSWSNIYLRIRLVSCLEGLCTKKNYDAFNAKCKYLANIYGIKLYYFYELYFAVLYEKTLKLLKAETEYFDELYENSKF